MVKTIGVVDGDRSVAKSIELNLRKKGYEVRQFANPQEAYDGREGIDMFVSEVGNFMGYSGINGLDLTAKLNEEERKIPVLILSGKAQDPDIFAGWDVSVASYLTKPYDSIELNVFIQRIFEDRERTKDYTLEDLEI